MSGGGDDDSAAADSKMEATVPAEKKTTDVADGAAEAADGDTAEGKGGDAEEGRGEGSGNAEGNGKGGDLTVAAVEELEPRDPRDLTVACVSAVLESPYEEGGVFRPLHWAVRRGEDAQIIAGLLVKFPDAARQLNDRNNRFPLHEACGRCPPLAVVQVIHEAFPDAAHRPDRKGKLPLHYACQHRASAAVVDFLLEAYPKGVRETTRRGELPLHMAAAYGQTAEVVSTLYEAYPEGARAVDKKGRRALMRAVEAVAPTDVVTVLHAASAELGDWAAIEEIMKVWQEAPSRVANWATEWEAQDFSKTGDPYLDLMPGMGRIGGGP